MKILVTGGCGFIGSYIVDHMIGLGHEVANVDCLTYAAADGRRVVQWKDSERYKHFNLDIEHDGLLRKVFQEVKPHVVIHAAAETHVDRSIDDSTDFLVTNVLGTANVLQAIKQECRGARLVYVSTDEVYGPVPGREQATESRKLHPKNPYAATKASAEHLVEAYVNTYGVKAVITRGTNTMGPMQCPEKFIPRACFSVMQGRPIPIYGDGTQVRQWLHVSDHAAAICNLALLDEDRLGFRNLQPHYFNIGANDAERTNMQIAELIIKGLEPRWPNARIVHIEDRPGHDDRYAVCNLKYRKVCNWQQFRDVEHSMWETVKWYAEQGQKFWAAELAEGTKRRGLR